MLAAPILLAFLLWLKLAEKWNEFFK